MPRPPLVAIARSDRDRQERAGHRARASGSTARSSAATRPPSIAVRHRHRQGRRVAEQRGIPHHLIDVADPTEEYSAARYAREAAAAIRDITARGTAADPGRRHRPLLSRADARVLSRAGARRRAAGAARARSPIAGATDGLHRMLRRVDPGVGRAHPAARSRSGWCARSRSTS